MVESHHKEENLDEDLAVFSATRWVRQTTTLASSPDELDADIWVSFLFETTNLFKKMGSAMSIAFSDITSKAEIIRKNKEAYLKETGKDKATV